MPRMKSVSYTPYRRFLHILFRKRTHYALRRAHHIVIRIGMNSDKHHTVRQRNDR